MEKSLNHKQLFHKNFGAPSFQVEKRLIQRRYGGLFFFLRKCPRFLKDVSRMFTRSIAIVFENARGF